MNNIEIVTADMGWLCVEKPSGMSVHNNPGNDLLSILERQIQLDPPLAAALGAEKGFKLHPVHRLDRITDLIEQDRSKGEGSGSTGRTEA